MSEEDIPLESPKGILEADQGRLPIVNDFEIGYDPIKIFVPLSFVISPKRSRGVVDLGLVIKHSRHKNYRDDMVGPGFPPFCAQGRQERMYDLFVIPFTIIRELPKLFTNLDKQSRLGG